MTDKTKTKRKKDKFKSNCEIIMKKDEFEKRMKMKENNYEAIIKKTDDSEDTSKKQQKVTIEYYISMQMTLRFPNQQY